MKKLISISLSFLMIFNVAGYGQTCDVSALEVNQQNGGQVIVSNGVSEIEKVAKEFWPLLGNLLVVTVKDLFGLGLGVAKFILSFPARIFLASDEFFTGALSSEISLCLNDERCEKELNRVIKENKKLKMCLKNKNCEKELERVLKVIGQNQVSVKTAIETCLSDEICKKEFDKVTG